MRLTTTFPLYAVLLSLFVFSACDINAGDREKDEKPPEAPSSVAASAASSSQINLSWKASEDDVGVTSYKVYRGGAAVATVSGLSVSDKGLSALTTYTYQITALDKAGNESPGSASVSATTLAASEPEPGPAAMASPADYGFAVPNPEPALPASWDAYNPPEPAAVSAAAPLLSGMIHAAGADETVPVSGVNFSSGNTKFDLFSQTNAADAKLSSVAPLTVATHTASFVVPSNFPAWSMFLVWPDNKGVKGKAYALNRTDAWWVGPRRAVAGERIAVYGRNLSRANGTATSYVYIKPAKGAGQFVTPKAVNPYKVDFVVPGLAAGNYEVWVHNTHGGHFGWSGPLALTVLGTSPWANMDKKIFNVKSYGALGNGSADDGEAIENALSAASAAAPATVYFPKGTYIVKRALVMPSHVRWAGDGRDLSVVRFGVNLSALQETSFISGGPDGAMIENLSINADNRLDYGPSILMWLRSGGYLKIKNSRLSAWGGAPMELYMNYLYIENSDIIGTGSFIGKTSDVFIAGNTFRFTNNGEYAIASWGGHNLSFVNNHVYNANENLADGKAIGRLFVAQNHWGGTSNLYFGGNQTHNAAPFNCNVVDCNKGEQILFEYAATDLKGKATAVSAKTVGFASLAPFSQDGGDLSVVVESGRGVGQHRRIVSVANNTATLDRPWDVIPDTSTSLFVIASVAERSVVYGNKLEGRDTYSDHDSDSTGVLMYGTCYDMAVDNNDISRMRHGIMISSSGMQGMSPPFFNLIANNRIRSSNNGIYAGHEYGVDGVSSSQVGAIGNVFRRNTITDIDHVAIVLDQWDTKGGNWDTNVFERNTATNTHHGFITGLYVIWDVDSYFRETPSEGTHHLNTVLRKNSFNRGNQPVLRSIGFRSEPFNTWKMLGNTYLNFEKATAP